MAGVRSYVQAGVQDGRGLGVHLVSGWYDNPREQEWGYWHEERAQVTWLSAQLPVSAWATLHAHAGYARGPVTKQFDRDQAPYIDEDRWVHLGGITVELHRPRR
ncbi:MAG: hypothetical protein ACYC3Q_10010 [Gemmatimonadaceae bacterium]